MFHAKGDQANLVPGEKSELRAVAQEAKCAWSREAVT
jgi:hypothetical protein